MNKSIVIIFIVLLFQSLNAQEYVDLIKVNYGTLFNAGFEGSEEKTTISLFDAGITYPIPISDKTTVITGVDYSQQTLELAPNSDNFSLNTIILKAGLNIKHNDRWSGTYLLLPKIASSDLHTDGDHFFFGGVALLKYQKSERIQYRLGAYASTEGFGILMTPILGLYYLSEDNNWEITANLPINADVNRRFSTALSVGLGFQAPVRSYSLPREEGVLGSYVQASNIELGPYIQYGILDNSILLRLQGGYSTAPYEVFAEDDTLPIRLSAFEFGDDRNLINPEMNGNLFLRIGAIYRFHITDKNN
ncbi:DUF6268 family outer membrane beta-barrel protein [Aquimarina pacifica]|uniref:DUF6268 family outer membrane beta-barrel protein n=1 Tax=Aquimarina pacifica TaxID=1296415 RepID=UPI000472248F|nr:DUF6268 family outer membrane beta-barrel protein [Aquimarina pacifica]